MFCTNYWFIILSTMEYQVRNIFCNYCTCINCVDMPNTCNKLNLHIINTLWLTVHLYSVVLELGYEAKWFIAQWYWTYCFNNFNELLLADISFHDHLHLFVCGIVCLCPTNYILFDSAWSCFEYIPDPFELHLRYLWPWPIFRIALDLWSIPCLEMLCIKT